LTRAISLALGVSEEQAEELKLKYGEVILDQHVQPQESAPDAFLDFGAPEMEEAAPEAKPMPFDFSEPEPAASTAPVREEAAVASSDMPAFDMGDDSPTPTPQPGAPAPLPVAIEQHDPTKVQVFGAIAPVLGEMLTELRRSMEYYRGRSADGRIDEILLCGGTARLVNLDKFFSSELGIPCRVADPLGYTAVATKNYSADYLGELAPSFPVAIGLAARDMVAPPVPVGGKRGKKK
jgi:Tfp pilus assembly PilM family ATPase